MIWVMSLRRAKASVCTQTEIGKSDARPGEVVASGSLHADWRKAGTSATACCPTSTQAPPASRLTNQRGYTKALLLTAQPSDNLRPYAASDPGEEDVLRAFHTERDSRGASLL